MKRIALIAAVLSVLFAGTASAAVNARQVYVLGDSYGVDMQGQTYSAGRTLTQAFTARGWTAIVSGRGGRGIGGSITPNGLQQAYTDRAKIAASSTVVVELGTNIIDGTYFATRAQQLLARIRSYQPAARIFWVTPKNYVTSTSYQSRVASNRNVILGLSGVGKIRWDLIARPAWFSSADGFKHPRVDSADADRRSDGYDALKDQIVSAVTGATATAAHVTAKVVRRAKAKVRRYVRAVRPGAQSIGLGVDVVDPLNHTVVLSGSFIRANGRRCVIRSAVVRHSPAGFAYSDCLGGVA